jgi:hypothetical protein
VNHVGDTTRDNASSTKPKTLVGYIEDARIRARDKCRTGSPLSYHRECPDIPDRGTHRLTAPCDISADPGVGGVVATWARSTSSTACSDRQGDCHGGPCQNTERGAPWRRGNARVRPQPSAR